MIETRGSELGAVLAAYRALLEGDPEPVIALLAADVEWWSQGVRAHRGREETSGLFTRPRDRLELIGVRKGGRVVVFEFARAWWKQRRVGHLVTASFGLHAEQAVWVSGGEIVKIETREHLAPARTSD